MLIMAVATTFKVRQRTQLAKTTTTTHKQKKIITNKKRL